MPIEKGLLTLAFFWNSSTSTLNKSRNSCDIFIILVMVVHWSQLNLEYKIKLNSVRFIKEIYKGFKIDAVTRFQTCNLNHSCRWYKYTGKTTYSQAHRQSRFPPGVQTQVLSPNYWCSPFCWSNETKMHLLFYIKHRKRMHQVVFGSLRVSTRFPNYFDKLFKLECLSSIRKFGYLFWSFNCLLWILHLVLRLGRAARSTIICANTYGKYEVHNYNLPGLFTCTGFNCKFNPVPALSGICCCGSIPICEGLLAGLSEF